MSFFRLIDAARQTFQHLPPEKRLLIIHPQFRYHNTLIDALFDGGSGNVLYVTLPEPETSLSILWDRLTREMLAVGVTLPSLDETGGTPAVLAKQFNQAMEVAAPLTVVLFAYDNAAEEVHEFIVQAADAPGVGRFVLSSRFWPHKLVEKMESGHIALLPISLEDMLLDYLGPDNGRMLLEVRALGSGQVFIGGRQIDQWDGALPRALFFYFVDRGMTTRDEVFATFWPELSTREATNVFHVTKRKISEILGTDLTVYSSGFYRISPEIDLFYDVISFVEAVQNSAVAEPDEARILLDRAIALHEHDFLGVLDQPWAARRRNELRSTYVDALTALARYYEDEQMITEALGLYNRAFGAAPEREDLARMQMRLYQQVHLPQQALKVYARLVSELRNTLGVSPSPETTLLAEQVEKSLT